MVNKYLAHQAAPPHPELKQAETGKSLFETGKFFPKPEKTRDREPKPEKVFPKPEKVFPKLEICYFNKNHCFSNRKMVLVIGKLPSVETGKDISQTGK